jgi:mono/diheme cytochrome c family protein
MTAEKMGKISTRLRATFALVSVAFVVVLAVSPVRDYFQSWKRYEKDYVSYAQARPESKRLLADFHPGIDQIWLPEMRVVDRCTTCHQGIAQASLRDPSVPQPFRAHPDVPHDVKKWGCVICHRGQGPATEMSEAHETTLAWEQPLLPIKFIQASCGVCHRANLPQTPKLDRGRELLSQLNCIGCHHLQDIERPAMLGPDLSNVGNKLNRRWIYKWLKEPHTVVDASGNTVVDGYETEAEPRMPQFRLTDQEIRALSAYLTTLKARPTEPYKFDPRVVAFLQKSSDLVDQGEMRFRQMFCTTCHSLLVTRGEETKLIGGDIGPELTKVGSKVNPDWLIAWLRNPQSDLPHALMPRYGWSDEDLYKVTQYINTKLTDPDLLSNVPSLEEPTRDETQLGQRLFLEKGCASCHAIQGVGPQKDFGPDLASLGSKNVSQLEFGNSNTPRNLIAYIQAKITDPLSVNPAARMPQYRLTPTNLDAITTALLSMTGSPANSSLARLIVPRSQGEFRPAGAFGELYDRYKCAVCHRFNGDGGTLAPDLSFEGSRAQRQWMVDFMKNPQTLRPTLIFRMPQFNMTDQEAAIIADYLGMVMQSPSVKLSAVDQKQFTPQMVEMGKQLFEVKYQCNNCHTIGSSGGYVGPSLNDAGNWLNAAWIEAWLKNPQALVPGTIEPRRSFTDQEVHALTAYVLALKQKAPPQVKTRAATKTRGGAQ